MWKKHLRDIVHATLRVGDKGKMTNDAAKSLESNPMEAAHFHYSHLKNQQDCGYQAVVMHGRGK